LVAERVGDGFEAQDVMQVAGAAGVQQAGGIVAVAADDEIARSEGG